MNLEASLSRTKRRSDLEILKPKEYFLLFIVFFAGVISIATSNNPLVYAQLMILAFCQNIAFSLVSRSRNRDNNNYHLIAAVGSNGIWFLTMSYMISQGMPISMLVPFLSGTTLGSLYGAHISKKIEFWIGLTADATKNTAQISESSFFKKYILFLCLGAIAISYLGFSENTQSLAWLMLLSCVQSIGFGLSSRAGNRGSQNYFIFTKIFSITFWFLTFGYLVTRNMPLSLFVPYTVATVFGSITGAQVSMKIERFFGFKPDEHVSIGSVENIESLFKEWWLFTTIIFAGFCYIIFAPSSIKLATMFFGTLIFATESMSFAIASRAGNRDSLFYHLCTRLVKGTVWFFTIEYTVIHNMSIDILVPVGLGVLGQKIGMKIEEKIGAVMDIPMKPKRV